MTCNACNRTIYDKLMSKTSPDNKIWHSDCLKCCECDKLLESKYFENSGRLYCRNDYLTYFGPTCFGCRCKITDEQYFFSIKQTTAPQLGDPLNGAPQNATQSETLFFHDKCFSCSYCSHSLQKGDKYCILDSSAASPQKTLTICHHMCALKYHPANNNNNIQSNTNQMQGGQSIQPNAPAPRAKRGRMKQNRPA